MQFNIYTQLQKEIQEFDTETINIANGNNDGRVKFLNSSPTGYVFSQKDTLNLVDLYYNSKYSSGEIDSEGQRKTFLNISQFRADVASKQTDIDVKNFVFIPEDDTSVWGSYFVSKQFRAWAKRTYLGELVNEVGIDYPKYGSVVVKKVGSELERVPLKTLRMQQDAKDLATARYVIEEHKDMTLADMKANKGWDVEHLDMRFGDKETVYERYGEVPLAWFKEQMDQEVKEEDHDETIDVMVVTTLRPGKTAEEAAGNLLFLEKITKRPYEEAHWKRQDGRWLGIGEVENQFENQVMRNMIANMRRRGLLWASKKIFQSTDTEVAKNLVKEVRDGEVIKIGPNGLISQVNMSTQALGEFQSFENELENNSNQKSFTFDVATGETLPSGTPFRLGVLLTNAVNSHFALKRENLGLFWKRVIQEQVYPEFKKQNRREHVIPLFSDEEGVNNLKTALIKIHANEEIKKVLLSGRLPNSEEILAKTTEEIESRRELFMKIPDGYYEDLKASISLVITGEDIDIPKRIETLTNLYNILSQKGDPRADTVLDKILALTGENSDALGGPAAQPAQGPALQQAEQALGQASPAFASAGAAPEAATTASV